MKFNKIRKCNVGRKSTVALTFVCLSGLTISSLTSCSDNEFNSADKNQDGTSVRFQITTANEQTQQAKVNQSLVMTRAAYVEQLNEQGLTAEDLATRKIDIPGNSKYCIIESTVAGIDNELTNTDAVATRAKITTTATLGKFSTIAYRGSSATSISTTPWFYNAETNANGTLANIQLWSWSEPYARFYAVYPQVTTTDHRLTLAPSSNTSTPYVNIEVEPTVQNQKDLMTACSGTTPIHYATLGTAPAVPLQFQHAMTAIRFKIGDRLSGSHHITKIEIVGAKSKGKFTLPSSVQATTGASFNSAWSGVSAPATFTLDGISVNTSGHVNETIVGKDNDNFTFYMIPQSVAGIKVKVYFDNQTSPAIVAPLAGTWKAGTTKTYALSQSANNLKYTFEATPNPSEAANTEGATTSYQITSYVDDDKQHRPVKWKVVSYDADGDGTFSMSEKPDWLTIPNEGRTTTQDVEQYTATFKANQRDVLADFNNAMKTADPVTNYNLANAKGEAAIENTANCYIISAPGTYRIPLVYGNAIKGGATNSSAYTSTKSCIVDNEEFVLQEFVDHNDDPITSPYINVQNSGDQATKAEVIWEDCQNIVTAPAVTGSGADSYLTFTIKKENLQNGNAVVAVTNTAGKVMWSWHLWFTPKSSLKTIPFTSVSSTYNFMTDNLGWKYTKWTGGLKREVVVKIEQQAETGEKKTATITLKQAPGNNVREGYGNLYQWGRKDPLPGTDNFYPNTAPNIGYKFNDGYTIVGDQVADYTNPANVQRMEKRTIGLSIREPGIMLPKVGGGKLSWSYRQYINLWSADNDSYAGTVRNGKKTIYDPSPVGFKVPDAYAFKDFSITGVVWSNGYTLKADNDKEIYFQAGGYRDVNDGVLKGVGGYALYWVGIATKRGTTGGPGYGLRIKMANGTLSAPINPSDDYGNRAYGFGMRSVAE